MPTTLRGQGRRHPDQRHPRQNGQVVSAGKLKTPAIIRSHGGRPGRLRRARSISTSPCGRADGDCVGNCRGIGGKSDCGSMGYAMTDANTPITWLSSPIVWWISQHAGLCRGD
ncbi:MAG: citrate lyase subunit alpha [Flavonifractor plautii]